MVHTEILCGQGGWYVEWFDFDSESTAYWYGSHAACVERAASPPPPRRQFARSFSSGAGDAATATGMYDRGDF